MAELLKENLVNRPIVTLQDVRNAIAVMGTPEDFGAESMESIGEDDSAAESTGRKSKKRKGIKTGKRLYRNPEDEVIGGVASGLAAYLGIEDPLWVRVAFIVIAFGMGFGIPFYLILWAIVPKAETASDRLAMRGEPINASNIGKIIEEEIEDFTNKVQDFGEELKDEFDNKKKNFVANGGTAKTREFAKGFRATLSKWLRIVGKAVKFVVITCTELVLYKSLLSLMSTMTLGTALLQRAKLRLEILY